MQSKFSNTYGNICSHIIQITCQMLSLSLYNYNIKKTESDIMDNELLEEVHMMKNHNLEHNISANMP